MKVYRLYEQLKSARGDADVFVRTPNGPIFRVDECILSGVDPVITGLTSVNLVQHLHIVAGWSDGIDKAKVYESLEAAQDGSGVFHGPFSDVLWKQLAKCGSMPYLTGDADIDAEASIGFYWNLTQCRMIVDEINAEGNYHEFVFRPAWPNELPKDAKPQTVK